MTRLPHAGPLTDPWLQRFRPRDDAALRLVCFPHAGGSASFYHPLSAALPEQVEVVAVQYPGRQERRHEQPLDTIADLADEAFRALRHWADRPLALFGHSMGAVIAFEVARRLEQHLDVSPAMLYASGRRAPSRVRHTTVHLRSDDGIITELRRLSGTDTTLLADPEVVRMIMPAVRGDYTAIERYRAQGDASVRCPITVLTGRDDPQTTADEAAAWRGHTTADTTVTTFPGGHFFIMSHQDAVLAELRSSLTRLIC
ncbi:alpha/beta fold hydrolase [Micromonospora lupini]|uniref:thioesterase II family protein n=1 Tax=Micromonospora lupini TaxID=285679 RepID=UPI0033DA352D